MWANMGVRLAEQTVRSWESAAQYYKSSAKIVSLMPFSRFEEWSECGLRLCQDSPTLAACYFNASHGTLQKLRARHVEAWAMMGRRLYKGTWKSGTLACKFFDSSPKLVQSLEIEDLDRFVAFLEYVSRRSYDVATDCIVLGERIFPALGEHNQAYIGAVLRGRGDRMAAGQERVRRHGPVAAEGAGQSAGTLHRPVGRAA